jgi:4-hydroxybenzoate polyprenyltransferase
MYKYILSVIKISRYRFWSYTAGTYFLGYLLGAQNFQTIINPQFILSFFYFLIPANIFLYGVNDYFDEDTDKFNSKKYTHEHKLSKNNRKKLLTLLIFCFLISCIFLLLTSPVSVQFILLFFIFLSTFYSVPPLRFKSKPFFDSASNVLYILPGIIGYIQTSGNNPDLKLILGFWFWAAAMHLFSAIPDISADTKAGLKTSAVVLGSRLSLLTCSALWALFLYFILPVLPLSLALIFMIYPLIPLILFLNPTISISKVYWLYPYINNLAGLLTFLALAKARFS